MIKIQNDIEEELLKKQHFFDTLNTPEELRKWVYTYIGINLPSDTIDPDSNSNPIEAMWSIYDAVKHNKGEDIPGYIMLSAREAYKTLSSSILEILILFHFQLSIAHMAAISSQSSKAISYIQSFLVKLKPYYTFHNWKKIGDSKSKIQFETPEGNSPYITVVICTLTGANCIGGDSILELEDGQLVRAAEIKKGQKIKTWDYKNNADTFVVSGDISLTKKHARKITFSNGSSLVVSDDHLMFTQNGWVFSDKVRIGDRVKKSDIVSSSLAIKQDHYHNRNLEQVIYGTLLGDASIQSLPSGNCRYQVFHSDSQKTYIDMIARVFKASGILYSISKYKNGWKLSTHTDPIFKKIREECYPDNKKTVSKEWLDKLSLEGIAYWLMDDVRGNSKTIGSRKDHCFELAVCGFDSHSIRLCKDFFNNRKFTCETSEVTNQNKKKWTVLKFDLRSSRILSEALSPFFIPELRYKLLPPISRDGLKMAVDTGEWLSNQKRGGFSYSNSWNKTRKGRKLLRTVKAKLETQVVEIELVGLQELVDLHIQHDDPTLRSFYANGVLVHNSEHVPIMFLDEVDVVRDPQAYEEAKLIPGMERGVYPITVKLSTRKFAFGMMQKELELTNTTGEQVKRWNILDVTEKCPESRYQPNPDGSKVSVYVHKKLPMRSSNEEGVLALPDSQQGDWEKIDVHPGCIKCPLLAVCKSRLADKPETAKSTKSSLYKPIKSVINNFRKTPPDMAEAQLMCWRPSTKGLIYPRFEATQENGNLISIANAWKLITGDTANEGVTVIDFVNMLHQIDSQFFAGVDWGYTHASTIVMLATTASGYSFIFDSYSMPGLEVHEFVDIAAEYHSKYQIHKWFCDSSAPANIKTLKRTLRDTEGHAIVPKFTKDILGGIEGIRSQIVTSSGVRKLLVLDTPENQQIIQGFKVHHFKLDMAGNPTTTPDDEEYADLMDALRYIGQNVFGTKNRSGLMAGQEVDPNFKLKQIANSDSANSQIVKNANEQMMRREIARRTSAANVELSSDDNTKKRKGIFWNMS